MVGDPVVAVLVGLCSGLRAAVAGAVEAADLRGRHVLESSLVEELEPVAPLVAHAVDRLHAADPERAPAAADGFRLGTAYARARLDLPSAALRPFLRHGLVRVLSPSVYLRRDAAALLAAIARLDPAGLPDLPGAPAEILALIRAPDPLPADWRPPWQRSGGLVGI